MRNEFYRRKIQANCPGAYADAVEMLARGLRKGRSTFGLRWETQTLRRMHDLINLLTTNYQQALFDRSLQIDKASNELLVTAEIDPQLALSDLITTKMYKLLSPLMQWIPMNEVEINRELQQLFSDFGPNWMPISNLLCLAIFTVLCPGQPLSYRESVEQQTLSFRYR